MPPDPLTPRAPLLSLEQAHKVSACARRALLCVRQPFCLLVRAVRAEVAECKHGVGCEFAWMSYPFMVSFVFIVQFMLVNLVVAVVLDNYGKASEDEKRVVNQAVFINFQHQWQKHDPNASGLVPVASLDALLACTRPPHFVPPVLRGAVSG